MEHEKAYGRKILEKKNTLQVLQTCNQILYYRRSSSTIPVSNEYIYMTVCECILHNITLALQLVYKYKLNTVPIG